MIASTLLENGIRVVTEQMAASRSIAIGILVMAGPRDEAPEKAGLAHLLEHALFHGTSSRNSRDIARIIDTMGGRVAAFTGRDYTCFSAVVMDDHRTYILDLLSDIILNSIFPEKKLAYEKEVIINENERGMDQPAEYAQTLLKNGMWPGHPLGRSIAGDRKTIAGLSREDIIYFLHSYYLPDRIIIGAAGNLDHEDIVTQVRDCFWRLSGKTPSTFPTEVSFRNVFVKEDKASSQSYFTVAMKAPDFTDQQRYSVHLLNTVIGKGHTSRLYRKLREEKGLVYDIHSEYHAYIDAGAVLVSGSSRPEQVSDVVSEVITSLEKLVSGEEPINEEELWQAKLYNIGQYHIDSEDPYTRMSRLVTQFFYFGRVLTAEEVIGGLESVDIESIAGVCGSLFQPFQEHVAASIVGPLNT
ncbi:MAG: hypothetical protein CSA26_06115 [Desulfobacterales bacterium]|nr:MAG: hypothetical protein CSA26_06115 [Desulfobacterales bacterium]